MAAEGFRILNEEEMKALSPMELEEYMRNKQLFDFDIAHENFKKSMLNLRNENKRLLGK